MAKRDHLVQEARVDKTGKVTKRWVKPSSAPSSKAMPAPIIQRTQVDEETKNKYARIAAGMSGRRPKPEVDDSPEKRALVKKIAARFVELGVPKPFQAGYNEQAAKERSADLLYSLDELLSHPQADASLAFRLQDRFRQLTPENLRDWLDVADKYFWELNQLKGKSTHRFDPSCEVISGFLHMKSSMKYNGQGTPTEQQCRNFLWTQYSAIGSNLEGERFHQGGGLGVATFRENDELQDFILTNEDEERLQRVAAALRNSGAVRFSEVLAIADGDTIVPLSAGAL